MGNGLHGDEKRQFERLLRQQGMNRLEDRLKVVESFLEREDHLTAQGWNQMLGTSGVDLGEEFVAETLELLTRFGLATRRDFEDEAPRYEHRHLDEHHDHLICTCCGEITEFHRPDLEAMKEQAAAELGFHALRHKLQIYGLCQKCRSNRRPRMPLAMASLGERVRIEELAGGEAVSHQLAEMGLGVGSELEVISDAGGSLVVASRGSRVALGRSVAMKVMVSQMAEPKACRRPGRGRRGLRRRLRLGG